MQALILAAGAGTRIGGREGGRPKALLEVGGRTLIEHQLDQLERFGVDSVVMVVGYEHEQIRDVVGQRASYVLNPRYRQTNSLYSFWLARGQIREDVVVLNSDILYDPRVLQIVLAGAGNRFAYDSDSGQDAEHMKVALWQDWLVHMSKELPEELTRGENVGIVRMSQRTAQNAFGVADRLLASGRTRDWLASAVNGAARRHLFRGIDVAGLPWTEIDFPEDLQRARAEVWPGIRSGLALPAAVAATAA
jgi:choline kinase